MNNTIALDIKRIFKGSSIYGAGRLLTKLLSFFLLPLYTVYLSPSDYGILATVNIIGSLLLVICMFSFEGAFARYYYDYKDNKLVLKKYLGTLIVFILLINMVLIPLLIILKDFLFIPFLPTDAGNLAPYIVLQLGTVFFGLTTNFLLVLCQVEEKPVKYVVLSLLGFVLSVVLVIYFIVFRGLGAYGSLLGGLISTIIVFIITIILLWPHITININLPFIKDAYRFGLPVTVHLLFGWLLGYSDRLVLLKNVSISDLGLYYFALQIGMVMYFVIEAINRAWTPFFFDTMKNRPDAPIVLPKIIHSYYVGIFFIALIGILFCKDVLTLFANSRYYESFVYIPFLIVNFLIMSFYFMNINTLFYFKKTKSIPLITLAAASVKLLLAYILIPPFKLWGAVASTITASIFWACTVYLVANRLYKIKYYSSLLFKLGAIFLILFVININIHISSMFLSILSKIGLILLFLIAIERTRVIRRSQLVGLLLFSTRAKS